jgi:hypothetical protein
VGDGTDTNFNTILRSTRTQPDFLDQSRARERVVEPRHQRGTQPHRFLPAGGGDIGLISSDPWSAGITHLKTSSNLQLKAAINAAGTLNSANNLAAVGHWFYAAYTIAGNGATDFKTWFNTALVGSATGSTNNILTDVNLTRQLRATEQPLLTLAEWGEARGVYAASPPAR